MNQNRIQWSRRLSLIALIAGVVLFFAMLIPGTIYTSHCAGENGQEHYEPVNYIIGLLDTRGISGAAVLLTLVNLFISIFGYMGLLFPKKNRLVTLALGTLTCLLCWNVFVLTSRAYYPPDAAMAILVPGLSTCHAAAALTACLLAPPAKT